VNPFTQTPIVRHPSFERTMRVVHTFGPRR
jgi:hypothetical protein